MRLLRIALCLAVVLCSGCQLRLGVSVEVDRNGGGVLSVAVTADEELADLAQDAGADPLGDLVDTGRTLRRHGWDVRDSTGPDGARTVTLTARFDDPAAFNELSAELADALAADEVDLLETLVLRVEEDRVAVTGGASARPTGAVRDYGLTRAQAVRLVEEAEAFAYDVTITMPGEILSSDATRQEGTTAVWSVPAGRRVALSVTGARPGPPILRVILGGTAGGAVAAAALWLIARRRRRRQPDSRSARMRAFSART